ncbi:unnamed protein product, partial [Phaeothamnion confervicola]
LVVFFLTGWFFTACETQSCGCVNYDLGIEVVIEDAAGKDLLDPSTDGYFNEQNITMLYEIKGKLENYGSMVGGDNPKGFTIYPNGDRYVLSLFSNPTAGSKVVTLLRIKDHPDVKLVTKVNGENGKRIEKIWYKDQLVWPVSKNDYSRTVTVTID